MKKIVSAVLCFAMALSLVVPAFAAESTVDQNEILGKILDQQTYPAEEASALSATATTPVEIIVSSVLNQDGSITLYEYKNNVLTQQHTTTPGSGVVESIYIDDDGSTHTENTITKDTPTQAEVMASYPAMNDTYILSPTSVRPLGYMHYRHVMTDTIFSINCEVREKYHGYEYFTFNKHESGSLSFWVSSIISIYAFHAKIADEVAKTIFNGLVTYGLIALSATGIYDALVTKTIPCYWYDQEIHGTPTAPSGRGKEQYLPGVYAYVNYGNGLEVRTEGYTVRDWGNASMGRWMMYNVFGIDESPTSWTNLDLRSIQ